MTSHGRTYRVWTALEDSKLVESLVNMVNIGGYKADNGFKSGYLQHLESCLKESLPNSGILGKPHIESRIKTMKKDWQCVYDMLNGNNTSGFGFDSHTHCVTADQQVWEAYLEVHKGAGKWRNKTFLHYEDLCIVFGKDRAQGGGARDAIEMNDTTMEEHEQHCDDAQDDSDAHTNVQSEECTSGNRKRRSRSSDSLNEVINTTTFMLGEKLLKVSETMVGVDQDIHKKTSMLASEFEKFESLSEMDMFIALRKITREPESVLTFWSLKEERREAWVRFMLDQ